MHQAAGSSRYHPVDSDPKMDQTPSASTASSDEQLVSMSLSPVGTAALLAVIPGKGSPLSDTGSATGTPEKSVADFGLASGTRLSIRKETRR